LLTSILILVGHNHVDSFLESLLIDACQLVVIYAFLDSLAVKEAQDAFQAFSATVTNRPAMRTSAKRPTSLRNVSIVHLPVFGSFVLVGRRFPDEQLKALAPYHWSKNESQQKNTKKIQILT